MTKKTIPSKKKENPFDKFANSKKKHEVVNRRVKGEDRNVGRARGKAVEIRRSKLIDDINSIKKTNQFFDRRFGENNANLSLEEKMFLRFQQERVKKAKRNKFNLDSSETPLLTHKGQILGSSIAENDSVESSDDENLGKDVVQNLHFGGGFHPAQQAHETLQYKHRADVLQEIVMKSKLHKLERKEAKNAQEDQREQLDKAYDDLVQSSSLEFKPTRRDRSEYGQPDDADEYDKSLRVMAFESRVKPSDRTLSKEEIALAEYQKLANLEKERLNRMKPESYPGEKRKAMNDDCIDDFSSADDPINSSSEYTSEIDDSDDNYSTEEDNEEEDFTEEGAEAQFLPQSGGPDLTSLKKVMPHAIECPLNFQDFCKLVDVYVKNARDFSILVERIRTWNSMYLPGMRAENERKLTIFLDILTEYFIFLGDSLQINIETEEILEMIECLSDALYYLAKDLPDAAQQVFIKKLRFLEDKVTSTLLISADSRYWPSVGNILLLQLFSVILSITDFQHCVVQPSQLLISQYLVLCPILCFRDLCSAILLCSILLNYSAITKDFFPEILIFLRKAFEYVLSNKMNTSNWNPLKWSVFHHSSMSQESSSSIFPSLLAIADEVLKYCPEEAILGILYLTHQVCQDATIQNFPCLWDLYVKCIVSGSYTTHHSLMWRPTQTTTEKMLTPAFEVDYKMKSSLPNGSEKAKLKILNKQLKREQKASMRELRRDSEFLDQENFIAKAKILAEKKSERNLNFSWLQQEQANFNHQIKKNGKEGLKGGGAGGVKKAKHSR